MKKQEFIKLGLSEEVATSCEVCSNDELKNYVSKAKFDSLNSNLQRELKLVEELKTTVNQLELKNQEFVNSQEGLIHQLKVDFAIELALFSANAINPKTVIPLLDLSQFNEFDDSGKIIGLDAEIEKLSTDDDTKFLFKSTAISVPVLKGISIGESGNDLAEQPTYYNASKMFS